MSGSATLEPAETPTFFHPRGLPVYRHPSQKLDDRERSQSRAKGFTVVSNQHVHLAVSQRVPNPVQTVDNIITRSLHVGDLVECLPPVHLESIDGGLVLVVWTNDSEFP